MEIFGAAITFLSIVLAILSWKNGRWMKTTLNTIHEDGAKRHEESINLLKEINHVSEVRHNEMIEWFKKTDERDEKRHSEVSELLKAGFGDVVYEIRKQKDASANK